MKAYLHMYNRNVQQNPLYIEPCATKELPISSRFSPTWYDFLSRCKFSTLTSTPLNSNRPYAQNPVFEIVHEEVVKIYLHAYNAKAQQNPLYIESCVTKKLPISPRFSPTSLRNFSSLPGYRLRCFVTMQI